MSTGRHAGSRRAKALPRRGGLSRGVRVDEAMAIAHGLSPEEFAEVRRALGRVPNVTELGLYSAMWSEHCSYKSSKHLLATLPTRGPDVLVGPGENAGVVRLPGGAAVAFKVESHNHPSYVEPYQGAATGVGGILRDVIAMGARPIALLDSLRFGDPSDARNAYLLRGVVAGIAGYGNCIGIPTVGGELAFDDCYAGNPLVNVMAVGVVGPAGPRLAVARRAGDPVIVFGARTGRDGIRGAAFASARLSADSLADRPAVQVGDPFLGKLLLEACMELYGVDGLVAIQDMGAAGLTCSSVEVASRGGLGMHVDLSRIPLRERGMTPYEIMLSESQERMLAVVRPDAVDAVLRVLDRWELPHALAGEVTEGPSLDITWGARRVASVPARHLTHGCPVPARLQAPPPPEPTHSGDRVGGHARTAANGRTSDPAQGGALNAYLGGTRAAARATASALDNPRPGELAAEILAMTGAPNLCSRRWLFERYDHMVGTSTIVRPGAADAAVMRIAKGQGVAVSTDGPGRLVWLDPREGARRAVAEGVLNLACVGSKAIAITDGLNLGDPGDGAVAAQLVGLIDGLTDACVALGVPVTGGNVSFYNQTGHTAVYPTPVIGTLGWVDPARALRMGFRRAGDLIYRVGPRAGALAASEFLVRRTGALTGPVPPVDLSLVERLARVLVAAAGDGLLSTAHDISDGGLAQALVECALTAADPSAAGRAGSAARRTGGASGGAPGGVGHGLGARLALTGDVPPVRELFSESPGRVIVSVEPAAAARLEQRLRDADLPFDVIGETGGERLFIEGCCNLALAELASAYDRSF